MGIPEKKNERKSRIAKTSYGKRKRKRKRNVILCLEAALWYLNIETTTNLYQIVCRLRESGHKKRFFLP